MAPTLKVVGSLLAAASTVSAGFSLPTFLYRDVVVVGGGAGGVYSTVRLKEDYGKSVVLIEKAGRLGGHVSTYDDASTGKSFDFGVQSFNDYGPAAAFFERMGVATAGPAPRLTLNTQFADFTNGAPVNWTAPTPAEVSEALAKYLNITAPWESYMLPGWWDFPAPNNIPEDLLLPFREFVAKHGLENAVNRVFQITGMGSGDMMNQLTIYVIAAFGQHMMRGMLGLEGSVYPASRRNIEIYEKAQTRLGNDVLYNTVVTGALRTSLGHVITAKDNTGKKYVIACDKLLMAIQPTPDNMDPFGLDLYEQNILSKAKWTVVHAGLVSHPALPINGSIVNMPIAASPNNYTTLPVPNYNVRFDYFGQDLFRVMLVGDMNFGTTQAQNMVRDIINKLASTGVISATGSNPGADVQFRAWANHGPCHLHVTEQELRNGYVQKLYSLQGRRGTWWTGAAFAVHFQALVWAFSDTVLQRMFP
ncbi:hypothetical protein VTJ04DRAFT_5778 [Mycothermus thermophilus]|uniref:uncharacterized protein n=1 Tax=Humicola insolens TaxID=85995 RepID=UPI0037436D44